MNNMVEGSLHVRQMGWIMTKSKANITQIISNLAHGCTMAWQWILTLGVTKVVKEKMVILQFVMNRAFFEKEVPKVHCKTLKTIDAHKINHIITPNKLLVEFESSIPSPTDMGKSTLTIVDKSLTGAVEIKKKIKKL